MNLDTANDYQVWDGMATYRFLQTRAGAAPDEALVLAKRRMLTTAEVIASGGAYTKTDGKLLIPQAPITFPFAPKPGDEWEDDDGTVYTVLEVPLGKFKQTWHCVSRALAIANQLRDTIRVEVSRHNGFDSVGAVQRTWVPLYPAINCRIQPGESTIGMERGVQSSQTRFVIPVERQLYLFDPRECRVVITRDSLPADATRVAKILDIEKYTAAERIGELPQIQAVLRG